MNPAEIERAIRAFMEWKRNLPDEVIFFQRPSEEQMIRWYMHERFGVNP